MSRNWRNNRREPIQAGFLGPAGFIVTCPPRNPSERGFDRARNGRSGSCGLLSGGVQAVCGVERTQREFGELLGDQDTDLDLGGRDHLNIDALFVRFLMSQAWLSPLIVSSIKALSLLFSSVLDLSHFIRFWR